MRRKTLILDSTAWFVIDGLLAGGAMFLSFMISPSYRLNLNAEGEVLYHVHLWQAVWLFAITLAIAAHIFELQNPLMPRHLAPMIVRCVGASWLAMTLFAAMIFGVFYERVGRLILVQVVTYCPLLMALARYMVWRQSGQEKWRLLLIGAGRTGCHVAEMVRNSKLPFEVVAFVDHTERGEGGRVQDVPVFDVKASLAQQVAQLRVDEIVTCVPSGLARTSMDELMACLNLGVQVTNYDSFMEGRFFEVPVDTIRADWFLHSNLDLVHPLYWRLKGVGDLLAAIFGLLLACPFLLLAAIAIKLESRGPIFYSQIRAGLLNKPYRMWKLRSMRMDAEASGPQWASQGDQRVTVVGRFLRKTRLDEVPQFWNILRGEMSLIGPRPERPEFLEMLAKEIPFYIQRHLVKPGITGWAQINYPYGDSVEDAAKKLKFDFYYIKYASVGLDMQIVLRSIGAIMRGAR